MSKSHNVKSPLKIAVFNHKGGVGKTTLTIHIATALAKDHKVLLVDADPQCNMTSYLLDEPSLDQYLDASDSSTGRTIWSGVKPISEEAGSVKYVEPIQTNFHNLSILIGDIRLSIFEADLTRFWNDCFARKASGYRGMRAVSDLANLAAQKTDASFIFYDTGPNIGALNRAVILDCDYIIVPAACDLFSLRAIKTLGFTLEGWIKDWALVKSLAFNSERVLKGRPALLGYIPQRFRTYRGTATIQYSQFMRKIEKELQAEVIARLKKISTTLVPKPGKTLKLGEIKDFSSLVSQAQANGCPLWELNGDQSNIAKEEFRKIAEVIYARTK